MVAAGQSWRCFEPVSVRASPSRARFESVSGALPLACAVPPPTPKICVRISRLAQQVSRPGPIPCLDNRRSLRQRQTRRKAGTQSHGPTSLADTAAGPPKAPEWVGVCSPHPLRIEGISLPLRPQDGEIDVSRYAFGACSGQGVTVRLFGCAGAPGLVASIDTSRRTTSASTGEVGRSHTPPTPDPTPCDSSPRTCVRTASERSGAAPLVRPGRIGGAAGSS